MRNIILVTGAAGNIGSAVSQLLAARGHRLALMERSADKLAALVATLPPGTEVLQLPGVDVNDAPAVTAMVAAITARFGGLDGLVNTVGGFAMAPVGMDMLDQWDRMVGLNARAALVLSAAVLPVMAEAGYGRILHVAAQPGLKAGARQAAYAGSKAALIRLVESIAAEQRDNRITANCILPGTVDTPDNRAAMPKADPKDWVTPESLAKLIAFLVSQEAEAVSGAAIPAAGLAAS